MYILDRFEENKAVIEYTDENGEISFIESDKTNLSADAVEGDVLIYENGIFAADKEAAAQRRREMLEKLKKLMK